MNNKGIRFLALAMVLAMAFAAVAVISDADESEAVGNEVKLTHGNETSYYSTVSAAVATIASHEYTASAASESANRYIIQLQTDVTETTGIKTSVADDGSHGLRDKFVYIEFDLNGHTLTFGAGVTLVGTSSLNKMIDFKENELSEFYGGKIVAAGNTIADEGSKTLQVIGIRTYSPMVLGKANAPFELDMSSITMSGSHKAAAIDYQGGNNTLGQYATVKAGTNVAIYVIYGSSNSINSSDKSDNEWKSEEYYPQSINGGTGSKEKPTTGSKLTIDGATIQGEVGSAFYGTSTGGANWMTVGSDLVIVSGNINGPITSGTKLVNGDGNDPKLSGTTYSRTTITGGNIALGSTDIPASMCTGWSYTGSSKTLVVTGTVTGVTFCGNDIKITGGSDEFAKTHGLVVKKDAGEGVTYSTYLSGAFSTIANNKNTAALAKANPVSIVLLDDVADPAGIATMKTDVETKYVAIDLDLGGYKLSHADPAGLTGVSSLNKFIYINDNQIVNIYNGTIYTDLTYANQPKKDVAFSIIQTYGPLTLSEVTLDLKGASAASPGGSDLSKKNLCVGVLYTAAMSTIGVDATIDAGKNVAFYAVYGANNKAGWYQTANGGTDTQQNSTTGVKVTVSPGATITGAFGTAYYYSDVQYGLSTIEVGADLTIYGGEFDGSIQNDVALVNVSSSKASITPDVKAGGVRTSISINGGFFTADPTKYVAEGRTVYNSGSFYAVGSPCTVTFDTQGGSAVESQTVKFYEPATVPAENPTMEGKQFGGWYTTASCDVKYDFSLPVTNDVTIYAGWTDAPKPTYTVAFESNGGSAVASQTIEEGKTVVRPNDPAKDGSRFNGWYTTSELKTKYVFSNPVESNMVLYAGWIATCTLSIPAAAEGCHYTIAPAQSVADIDADHLETVTVTVEAGYEGKLYINGVEQPGLTYAMTSVEQNISVSVKITEASGKTTESTQEITENDDGSVTDMNTVIETEGTTKTITEEASTTKDAVETEKAKTVAEVSGSGAVIAVTTDNKEEAKVTESMAQAIIDAVEAGSAVAIDVSTPAVSVPANLFSNELGAKVDSVTVAVNQDAAAHSATITIPKGAIETGTESISLSVTASPRQADAAALNGSSAIAAFNLEISNAASGTEFARPVTVAYDVELPSGAYNVRFYCIDDGTYADRTVYANGTATGTLGHFSAWTIVYDLPADADNFDDELPPTWHYVPQQQSSSSHTTMIVAACAAAVAAIAVALVMLNVVRKN